MGVDMILWRDVMHSFPNHLISGAKIDLGSPVASQVNPILILVIYGDWNGIDEYLQKN